MMRTHAGCGRPIKVHSKILCPEHGPIEVYEVAATTPDDLTEELRTPGDWAAEDGIRILDPKGWWGPNARHFNQPIAREEYLWRMVLSTIRRIEQT